MKGYLVNITANLPYPRTSDFTISCSNFSAAIGKAVRQWRKEIGRKKVKQLSVRAIQL